MTAETSDMLGIKGGAGFSSLETNQPGTRARLQEGKQKCNQTKPQGTDEQH